jgi:1,4-alpha-glucan branching enzyme
MARFDFGPIIAEDETVFRLWAPLQERVTLRIEGEHPIVMCREKGGWHVVRISHGLPGARYSFMLANGLVVPDPASRHQPDDVHGPSELVDLHYPWKLLNGMVVHGKRWSSMNCTSARLRREEPSFRRLIVLTI